MAAVIVGNGYGLLTNTLRDSTGDDKVFNQANPKVNVTNGNLVLQKQDQFIVNAGEDFDLLRTYNSQGYQAGMDAWRFFFQRALVNLPSVVNAPGSQVTLRNDDGAEFVFHYDEVSSSYFSSDGAGADEKIQFDVDKGQWLHFHDGGIAHDIYNQDGRLIAQSDGLAQLSTFHYDNEGLLQSIKDQGKMHSDSLTKVDSNESASQIRERLGASSSQW